MGANADIAEPHFQFEISGNVKGARYHIENSADLKLWKTFLVGDATAEVMTAGGPLMPLSPYQFFRVTRITE